MAATNRLARETSPYLRQHAGNPVDWHPWGEEALAEARRRDVPLFLSIGYSACHWCHVMAHESFESEQVAALLNDRFVAVKVDREERPDVDSVYMDAVQAMTGSGGWPLSVFTLPDGRPFFGGTYFPPTARHGMPSFSQVLDSVSEAWRTRREELAEQAGELTAAVSSRLAPPPAAGGIPPAAELLEGALARVRQLYDPEHGGIGRAPKFPQAPTFELVAHAAWAEALGGPRAAGPAGSDVSAETSAAAGALPSALEMLTSTLEAMASGGMYDHLAGGFARYSVDRAWQVPHFEKMLYDQAMLAPLYLHGWQLTGDERWRQVVTETLDYACSTMRHLSGGFYSSEDADAGGEEGRFSTWTPSELEDVLGAARAARAAAWYGITRAGNFEHGRSIPHVERGRLIRPPEIEQCRVDLEAARRQRVRPAIDDKVLTEWNAMLCSALAQCGAACQVERWVDAAAEGADLLLERLRRPDGRLLRSWQPGGQAAHLAVAADYAWLVDCLTRLGEATGSGRYLEEAQRAALALIELFSAEDGGWYTTGSDAEQLVVRPRETYDGVTPAAGSVAATALARLGALTADERLSERALESVAAAGEGLVASPAAFPRLVEAALLLDRCLVEVVSPGRVEALVRPVQARYSPAVVLAWGEPGSRPLLAERREGLAYVCRAGACLAPVESPDELLAAILAAERAGAVPTR